MLAGLPAFIVGNSPKLPVDDLDCLAGQFTIGVNRILVHGFTPTVLLWVDGSVYDDDHYGEMIDACDALLVCDKSVARNAKHHGLKTWVGDAALEHQATVTELCVKGNTGCCAARWAIAIGCAPVYLVGMEAVYDNGKTDSWGVNARHRPGSTLMGMRHERERLEREYPDKVFCVSGADLLREFAAESPDRDQDELRAEVGMMLMGFNPIERK